jgi:hypothetical protein
LSIFKVDRINLEAKMGKKVVTELNATTFLENKKMIE